MAAVEGVFAPPIRIGSVGFGAVFTRGGACAGADRGVVAGARGVTAAFAAGCSLRSVVELPDDAVLISRVVAGPPAEAAGLETVSGIFVDITPSLLSRGAPALGADAVGARGARGAREAVPALRSPTSRGRAEVACLGGSLGRTGRLITRLDPRVLNCSGRPAAGRAVNAVSRIVAVGTCPRVAVLTLSKPTPWLTIVVLLTV